MDHWQRRVVPVAESSVALSPENVGAPECLFFARASNDQFMRKADEYRANAAECRRMADSKESAQERHMWRDMSASWLGMITHAEREEFADKEREYGTKQPSSNSSH